MNRPLRGIEAVAALLVAVPMLQASRLEAAERTRDTRQMASAWVGAHIPPGRTILIENAAFDLLSGDWRFLFPLGAAGCVEVHELLSGRIRYGEVEPLRVGRSVIDVGHLDAASLKNCRPDVMVLSHYQRYQDDGERFRAELANYRALTGGSRLRAVFRPSRGSSSGPVVHIFERTRSGKPPATRE